MQNSIFIKPVFFFSHFDARTAERYTNFTVSWMAENESYGLTSMVNKECVFS
jgi:ribose 1,5-bisphosphokinase PhnN